MGLVLGKIDVETPKFELLHSCPDYEIRLYSPSVVAQVTYDPSNFRGDGDGGFGILAAYIGAIGKPQNRRPEKIAMTAPVITSQPQPEKIAMTAPVITSQSQPEKIAMTAPVITSEAEPQTESSKEKKMVTMQFVLPSKYSTVEEAPAPVDERVVIREEGARKYAVVRFNGIATEAVVEEKVRRMRECVERDGHNVTGGHLLGRYNPPWTIPAFRTNEILLPLA